MRRWGLLGAVAVLWTSTAMADVALVIAGAETERRGLLGATDLDTRAALRGAGFDVISADASNVAAMRAALSQLLARIDTEPRVIVHLTGRFVQGGKRSWMLETDDAIRPDVATVDDHGLSVETVLNIVASLPGSALVSLGRIETDPATVGAGLELGTDRVDVPQGVTLFEGSAGAVARMVREQAVVPGRVPARMADSFANVTVRGYLGRAVFLPEDEPRPIAPPDPAEAERAIWQAAQAQDDLTGYGGYLDRYPTGLFAAEARAAIEAIEAEPARDARLAEEALALSRDDRRRIQRALTLLNYNPRGVDGIFGPGTRTAITAFQAANGFPASGFLDRLQIDRLDLQAERRQAEIEAEKERQRLEAERQDRVAWEATGAVGDEAGLRTYLRRYPKGLYAAEAERRIAEIERARNAEAEARELAVWDSARQKDTVEELTDYLLSYPDGAYSDEARDRIAELQRPPETVEETLPEATIAAARDDEARLNFPDVTLLLVERRLQQLGFEPGTADGVLDDASRQAIRAFQAARDLPDTGYLTEATVARMLSDLGSVLVPRQ